MEHLEAAREWLDDDIQDWRRAHKTFKKTFETLKPKKSFPKKI